VFFVGAVREIKPENIGTGLHQGQKLLLLIAGRAYRGHDLRSFLRFGHKYKNCAPFSLIFVTAGKITNQLRKHKTIFQDLANIQRFTDFLRKSSVFPAVAADLKPTEPESIRTISVLFTLGSKCIGIDKEGMVYTEGG
jgi:hypothetical protein